MAKQCNTCGGIYEPLGPDGVAYYHTCPPIVMVPVMRDGEALLVPLADLQKTDRVAARRGDDLVRVVVADLLPTDVRVGDVHAPRPNHRDETVVASFVGDKVVGVPKAEGLGVKEIAVAPATGLEVFDRAK